MLFHDSICFYADSAVRAVNLTPQPQCVSVFMCVPVCLCVPVCVCVFERVCLSMCVYSSRLIPSHSCAMLTLQHLLMSHLHVPQSYYQHHTLLWPGTNHTASTELLPAPPRLTPSR